MWTIQEARVVQALQINTEFSGLQPNGAPVAAPAPKRAAATLLRDGDRTQEDRRQNQNDQDTLQDGSPVFKTLFTEATLAGLQAASSAPAHGAEAADEPTEPEFVRAEKRPEKGPVSLSSEDTSGLLYSYRGAARQASDSNAVNSMPSQAYVAATSRYNEQSVAAVNVFAGRGDILELQA